MKLPVLETILDGILGVFLLIDNAVYSLISSSFRIFMALASARLLTSEAYTKIANKLYVVIGVLMLFVLSYALIRTIIDPEQASKGDMGGPKILKNIAVAIVGLAVAPVIFNFLYQGQSLILENDVLLKLFFRTEDEAIDIGTIDLGNGNSLTANNIKYNTYIKQVGGSYTSMAVWQAFFYPSADSGLKASDIEVDLTDFKIAEGVSKALGVVLLAGAAIAGFASGVGIGVGIAAIGGLAAIAYGNKMGEEYDNLSSIINGNSITLEQAYEYAGLSGDFAVFTAFIPEVSEGNVTYRILLSTIAGIVVAYAFISFSIDMGVRAAKLAYYQIIAPIPLILQILPKFKGSFEKYYKSVITTFVEVFVRISVVYICVYIICHLTELFQLGNLFKNQDLNNIEQVLAMALLIVGLVIFAKQAPKMISETFGLQTGQMHFGITKKLGEGGVFAAGAIAGSTVQSAIKGYRRTVDNPSDPSGALIRRLKGAGSFAFGAMSGGTRAITSQFTGPNPAEAKTFKDMKRVKEEAVEKTTRKQEKRQDFVRMNSNPDGKLSVEKAVNSIRKEVKSKWNTYSYGMVDASSYRDQQKLIETYVRDLESQLESSLSGKDAAYDAAIQYKSGLESEYQRDTVLRSHLKDFFNEAGKKGWTKDQIDAELTKQFGFGLNDFSSDLQTKIATAVSSGNFSDVKSGIGTEELRTEHFTAALAKAVDQYKTVKNDAVARKLAEAEAIGVDNDTSRKLKSIMSNNAELMDLLERFGNVEITDESGKSVTFEQFFTERYGDKIDSGQVSIAQMMNHQKIGFDMNLEGFDKNNAIGLDNSNFATLGITEADYKTKAFNDRDLGLKLRYDEATQKYCIYSQKTDANGKIISTSSEVVLSAEQLSNLRTTTKDDNYSIKATGTVSSVVKGGVRKKGPVKQTTAGTAKDVGEVAADRFTSSDAYRESVARELKSKNDKKKDK